MRIIRVHDVLLQYIFIFLFAGSLVAGVFRWPWFIVAGVAIVMYFIWSFWRLRCPWCRGAVELGDLLRGRRGQCHCPVCGHEIIVVTRLGKLKPGRNGPRRLEDMPAEPDIQEIENAPADDETFAPESAEGPDDDTEDAVDAILGMDPDGQTQQTPDGEEIKNTEIEGSILK